MNGERCESTYLRFGAELPPTRHSKTVSVATCFNCFGVRTKTRVRISRDFIQCPDCSHVLFWERVPFSETETSKLRTINPNQRRASFKIEKRYDEEKEISYGE